MQKKHTMNRHLVESIVCSACETEQPPVANCGSCGTPSPRSKLASMQHAAASVWPRHSLGACSLTHTFHRVHPPGECFGAYFCAVCNLYDDDLSKHQFHCEECGICRVGGRENFFHCSTCGACYSVELRNNHVCVPNSMQRDCPICYEYLFDSLEAPQVLRCGHTIHRKCLEVSMHHF